MPKNNRLSNIILWSLIAAAFIGPGTVTTASAAGSNFGYSLIWTIAFSIIGCLILQEASARVSITSESTLPKLLSASFKGYSAGKVFTWFVGLSVVIGCMAYQAGNMVGAISGLKLISGISKEIYLILLSALVAFLLVTGKYKIIANALSVAVGVMGLSFFVLVLFEGHGFFSVLKGFIPSAPSGSGWIILGLIGTTIVPYNLFLGSGLSKGQNLSEMRLGLGISVLLGGLITMAILVNGTMVAGNFTFEKLGNQLIRETGEYGVILLGIGLAAAGITSSVTAPLAGAIITRDLFHKPTKYVYQVTWILIVFTGFVFGMLDIKPVPLIILAQALNGLILPLVAIILFKMVNKPAIVKNNLPGIGYNLCYFFVLGVSVFIGINNLLNVLGNLVSIGNYKLIILCSISLLVMVIVSIQVYNIRKQPE